MPSTDAPDRAARPAAGPFAAGQPVGWPSGWRLIALDTVDSTNRQARDLAAEGAVHGTVVTARRQEKGRGRYGRGWVSEDGNLYVSVVLRPPGPLEEAGQLTFVIALATADALAALAPSLDIALKWPNDVLAKGRKIAGILLESESNPDLTAAWVVAGVGLNLASHPDRVLYPATDLAAVGTPGIPPEQALAAFVAALDRHYRRWREAGFAAIRESWMARAAGLGGPIEVRLHNETVAGLFAGLDLDGSLMVDLPDGARRCITAGDVFYTGPAGSGATPTEPTDPDGSGGAEGSGGGHAADD